MGGMRMGTSGRIQNGRSPGQGARKSSSSSRAPEKSTKTGAKPDRGEMQSPLSVLDARLEEPADSAEQPLPYAAVVGTQPKGQRSRVKGLHRKSRSLDGADVQASSTSPWDPSDSPAFDGCTDTEQALRSEHPWASQELARVCGAAFSG